jgi:hypothetical protein
MPSDGPSYDPRYLAGIVLFNRGDFFEAHEVWESLWMENSGEEKKFVQGLIQAAVALCHFCNGNARGAVKLYKSGRAYMERYDPHYMGLDRPSFWDRMEQCFAPLLAAPEPPQGLEPQEDLIPTIELDPAPQEWPDPAEFLDED